MKFTPSLPLWIGVVGTVLSSTLITMVMAAASVAQTLQPPNPESPEATRSVVVSDQTYRSQRLGLAIVYPKTYKLDTTQEIKGSLRLMDPDSQAAGAATATAQPGSIVVSTFANPKRLSSLLWAQTNAQTSFFPDRQGNYRTTSFAGQPALKYSWCAMSCGDSVVFPNRDRSRIIVFSALYRYPSDSVRWEFERLAGKFRFSK